METETALGEELRTVAEICLERLRMQLRDEAMEAKDLLGISKETRAMATLLCELAPAPATSHFHLTLTVDDGHA